MRSICSFDGCAAVLVSHGYCGGHWAQVRDGRPLAPLERRKRTGEPCVHTGCDRPGGMRGLCSAHLRHMRLYGETRDLRVRRPSGAVCSYPDCARKHYSMDLCATHYYQSRRDADLKPIEVTSPCQVPRCAKRARGRCVCASHHRRAMRYGLTDEEFIELITDAICAICGTDEPRGPDFAIDHDHSCCPGPNSCGQCVRGVLCVACNTGLGAFADDVDRMAHAIEYLVAKKAIAE